jgi:hypothetical protein
MKKGRPFSQFFILNSQFQNVCVAQLAEAPRLERGGCEFESHRGHVKDEG